MLFLREWVSSRRFLVFLFIYLLIINYAHWQLAAFRALFFRYSMRTTIYFFKMFLQNLYQLFVYATSSHTDCDAFLCIGDGGEFNFGDVRWKSATIIHLNSFFVQFFCALSRRKFIALFLSVRSRSFQSAAFLLESQIWFPDCTTVLIQISRIGIYLRCSHSLRK